MGEITGESQAWNIAQNYTSLKILKPLVEMDKLVKIAIYGCENIEGTAELEQMPGIKTSMRIQAIHRMVDILQELFENADFAMSKTKTKDRLNELQAQTKDVASKLHAIQRKTTDQRNNTSGVEIKEIFFMACLNKLRYIKQEIPKPLNENGLIFAQGDEIDLDKIKKEIIEHG